MKRMFINLLVYLLISSYQLKSQTLYSVDKWMEYIEEMASKQKMKSVLKHFTLIFPILPNILSNSIR